jgi:acyl carrier protein
MGSNAKTIQDSIYAAIDELITAGTIDGFEKNPEAKLFGKGATLDSLALVTLIVMIEQAVGEKFNRAITLADERAMSQLQSPFRTVASLAAYVEELLSEQE